MQHKSLSYFKAFTSQGYSLIEAMIAITISLILLAGVLQIFLNTRNVYNLESDYSQLQENSRYLSGYMSRIIRLAGYRTPPTSGAFQPIATVYATTPYITGSNATGFNGSDTLVVSYQGSGSSTTPDGFMTDCLGNAIGANTMVTNTFSLTSNYTLQCQSVNPNASPTTNTLDLVSGVENFQVLYGEDVNGDNTADRYVNASYPYLQMSRVVSVRLSFLLRSTDPINNVPGALSYNLLGTVFTPPVDHYLRQQVTFTIVLRNLLATPT